MAVEAGGSNIYCNTTRLTSTLIPHSVQNHLLDTKIYATVGENDIFHIRPSTIHFQGFQAGKKYTQKFRIINASSECQRMHIIPPVTSIFKVKYQKTDSLVPGMYLEITVEFAPEENQYHYDCIRIHSKGISNLIIPIYAYLVVDISSSFPKKINFKPTLVGDQVTKRIPMRNDSMGDFDFQISFVEKHKAFEIEPMSGLLPANKTLDIIVSFCPTEFCTMCATIQIVVSQFNSQPFYCKLTGSSEPGLASKMILKQLEESSGQPVKAEQRVQTPLERSRIKKQSSSMKQQKLRNSTPKKELVQDGISFPNELNSQAAVAYVLGQHAGKMKAKDIKKVVQAQTETTTSTKQVKQAIFEHIVSKNVTEEQRNQLRWCVNLGEEDVEASLKQKVAGDRERAIASLNLSEMEMMAYNRSVTNTVNQRIHRKANTQTEAVPTFDLFLNDEWTQRHTILKKFIHAARKVILRSRAQRNLRSLHDHLDHWRQKNFMSAIPKVRKESNKEQLIIESLCTQFDEKMIKPFAFPQYHDPDKPDDMAVNSLGRLDIPCTYVPVHNKVQLYKLKVPQQYKTLSYDQHLLTSMVYKYVPRKLERELRTGAENEITLVDSKPPNDVPSTLNESIDDLQVINLITPQLTMPSSFLEPNDYHPLHIFNPLPGVQTQPQPLPYSEIDDDYRLCPAPKSQALKLDRHLVIPDVMTWRKFPCHSLLVMTCPSLSNAYLPRWTDPFDKELWTVNIPPLLTSLPEDDAMEDTNESDNSYVPNVPTMDMVRAEFVLVDDLTQDGEQSSENNCSLSPALAAECRPQENINIITKEKLACDLDVSIRKSQNVLGEKIESRVRSIQEEWKLS